MTVTDNIWKDVPDIWVVLKLMLSYLEWWGTRYKKQETMKLSCVPGVEMESFSPTQKPHSINLNTSLSIIYWIYFCKNIDQQAFRPENTIMAQVDDMCKCEFLLNSYSHPIAEWPRYDLYCHVRHPVSILRLCHHSHCNTSELQRRFFEDLKNLLYRGWDSKRIYYRGGGL